MWAATDLVAEQHIHNDRSIDAEGTRVGERTKEYSNLERFAGNKAAKFVPASGRRGRREARAASIGRISGQFYGIQRVHVLRSSAYTYFRHDYRGSHFFTVIFAVIFSDDYLGSHFVLVSKKSPFSHKTR